MLKSNFEVQQSDFQTIFVFVFLINKPKPTTL